MEAKFTSQPFIRVIAQLFGVVYSVFWIKSAIKVHKIKELPKISTNIIPEGFHCL